MLDKAYKLSCADMVRYEDNVYILTRDTQSLFEYCFKTQELRLCGSVANKCGQVFISMALCNSKIYIAPYEADHICVYDIQKREFERIPIEKEYNHLKKNQYHICFSHKNKVYFLGNSGVASIFLDTKNNRVTEITDWLYDFKKIYNNITWVTTHMNVCVVDDCFWIALKGENILLQYNMESDEYQFWEVGKQKIQYTTICFDGSYFWLTGDKKLIIRWDKENNKIKEFKNFPAGFEINDKGVGWKELFINGCSWNKYIYYFPMNSNMLVKINRESGEMESILKIPPHSTCLMLAKIEDDKLYIEIDSCINNLIEKSYVMEKNDTYREFSIMPGKDSELSLLDDRYICEMDFIIENHTGFLNELLRKI